MLEKISDKKFPGCSKHFGQFWNLSAQKCWALWKNPNDPNNNNNNKAVWEF
jgi:hypothetical protein